MMNKCASAKDRVASQIQVPGAELGPKRCILVVNPDMEERRTTKEKLRNGITRCQTYAAATSEEALSMLERVEIDCVVLSETEKRSRGFELIGQLTSLATLQLLPVVVLGKAMDADVEKQALDAGATIYIGNAQDNAAVLCYSVANAIERDRLMRVVELQSRQIQDLNEERKRYAHRTDELAHELLTPLAAIQEFVSLVFDGISGPINERQSRYLACARGGCNTIRTTVESLIVDHDFQRIFDNKRT